VSRTVAFLFVGLMGMSLVGCGLLGSETTSNGSRPVVPANPNHSKSVFINDLRLEIATLKKDFPADEIVPLRVSITNTGDKDATLTYPTGQKYEFSVTDSTGAEVWQWSAGRSFTQEIVAVKVKPTENYNFFGRIDAGLLPPGVYTATAWITAEELAGEKISLEFKISAV
jgi:hypothetical protein